MLKIYKLLQEIESTDEEGIRLRMQEINLKLHEVLFDEDPQVERDLGARDPFLLLSPYALSRLPSSLLVLAGAVPRFSLSLGRVGNRTRGQEQEEEACPRL